MSKDFDTAAALIANDPFVRSLGIELKEVNDCGVVLEMTVANSHRNFLGGAHGGLIFSLADTAFGIAANTNGIVAIGIDTHMAYIQGCRPDDRLRASSQQIGCSRRVAVYRVDVTRDAETVATFTGTVYLPGRTLADTQAP